jgi:cholesterol oxidase
MARLSKNAYETVVVGSGFGGAVAACRLAQAGVDVAVLERGRRYGLGEFPRHPVRYDRMHWHEGGPYDLRPLNEVLVVQGAGYGGGSLIYANVQIRPPAEAFDDRWPTPYSRQVLDPYYDLVAYMLDIAPVQADPATGELPPKTRLMEEAADRLGRGGQFFRPNLAIRFDGGDGPTPNKFGALQSRCLHCGDCDIGCNLGAKNTLDLNYLTLAERAGAEAATRAELTWLAPGDDGFEIRVRDLDEDGAEHTVAAKQVFLCLGAVNSTEFLLRCRDQHRTLPRLSRKLGAGYSANGDFLAFGVGTSPTFAATNGPTITTACVHESGENGSRLRLMVEDGGYSHQLSHVLPLLHPVRLARLAGRELGRDLHALLEKEGDATAALLVMGRDSANGTIELVRPHHRLRVRWDTATNLALYAAETAACRELVSALGGTFAASPNWSILGQPSAPHNLGGCRMALDERDGVVDPEGRVFGYPGLHVLDGAIVPDAVGVNPSHTIAAVAERSIEAAIRQIPGRERWSAPETAKLSPVDLPEDRVSIPAEGTRQPSVSSGGARWRESMRGTLELVGTHPDAGFEATVVVPDVVTFVRDPAHPGRASGRVHVQGLTGREGAPIEGGTFHLFIDEGNPVTRTMLYSLPFHAADDRPWVLEGRKDVRGRTLRDFWHATTTLQARLVPRDDGGAPGAGALHINAPGVARLLASFRSAGGGRRTEAVIAPFRFARFFAGTLLRLYLAGKRVGR